MDLQLATLLREQLDNHRAAVSIGGFGALAEFEDEDARFAPGDGALDAVSARGGCRVHAHGNFAVLAYEMRSAQLDSWQYGIALTVSAAREAGPVRMVLTELGPDSAALRADDSEAVLFDLGVGLPNVEYCVRSADGAVIDTLRRYCGTAVAAAGHPLLEHLIDCSPHRVARSAAGRIEVYQRIDRHHTPSGPHTHLLPALLARRRTHSANIPVPRGRLPVLTLHPEHPLRDRDGERRAFARGAFTRFEDLLARHGPPGHVEEKARLRCAVTGGSDPQAYVPPRSRSGRLAMRIALRQLPHELPGAPGLDAWLSRWRR